MIASVEENKERAWKHFEAGETRLESRPFKASIEISRNCNLRCVMCPQSWDPRYAEYRTDYNMSAALFGKVADELFPYLDYVHLQGFGETVISPHWLDILELCRPWTQGRRFGLVTNLMRSHHDMWRKMADMGFVVIASCDGATKDTFERIRRGGSFDLFTRNLELMKGRPGKRALLVTLQKLNYREMPLFVELAARHGASPVTFSSVMEDEHLVSHAALNLAKTLRRRKLAVPDIPGLWELVWERAKLWLRHGSPRLSLDGLRLAELREKTLERGRQLGVEVRFNDSSVSPSDEEPVTGWRKGIELSGQVARFQRCFKPYSYVVVNHRGDVGLCNHLITDSGWKQLGNLAEQPFEEIWNSDLYRELRQRLLEGRPDNPACAWCFKHRLTD